MFIFIATGFVVITLLLLIFVYLKTRKSKNYSLKELQYIKSHWIRIIDMFPGNPSSSILEADKLLDYALSKKGKQGSLGEKLKNSSALFKDINSVWSAHKLRNKIAHELGDVDKKAAKRAIRQFKQALNDLGAAL